MVSVSVVLGILKSFGSEGSPPGFPNSPFEQDTSDDPVDSAVFGISNGRCWSQRAGSAGEQVGKFCYYCVQVTQSRYKHKGYTVSTLVIECGKPEGGMMNEVAEALSGSGL